MENEALKREEKEKRYKVFKIQRYNKELNKNEKNAVKNSLLVSSFIESIKCNRHNRIRKYEFRRLFD